MITGLRRFTGVTLIELVIVLTAFAILSITFMSAFVQVSQFMPNNLALIQANAIIQACAEHIIATRRYVIEGYEQINAHICQVLPLTENYQRQVSVNELSHNDITHQEKCPAPARCKQINIVIEHENIRHAQLHLLLVAD